MKQLYLWSAVAVLMSVHLTCAACPSAALAPLSFVLEYAVWRGWHQAVLYTPDIEKDCAWATVRLVKCLGVNGIASATNVKTTARIYTKLGIVVISPYFHKNATEQFKHIIRKLHELKMGSASYDWLLVARSESDLKNITHVLNATSIRFDHNVVVGYPHVNFQQKLDLCYNNFIYTPPKETKSRFDYHRKLNQSRLNSYEKSYYHTHSSDNNRNEFERNYFRTSQRYVNLTRHLTFKKSGNVLPLFQAGILNYNYSRSFEMTNVSKFYLREQYLKWSTDNHAAQNDRFQIYLVQYFKARINSTLYAHFLGSWIRAQSMSKVEIPYPVEARNFLGEELVVGRCNSSGDGTPALDDDGPAAPDLLDDVLNFLTVRLNSSASTRFYGKLGFRTYEGTWTGLLGSLMESSVDLALEPVTAHATRHYDMDFIFPIAETMCNIYIRHQETSTVRDIFLAPFSGRLVACVVAVALVAALAIAFISQLAPKVWIDARTIGYTEAILWSIGILCQQGGTWTPPNPSASVLLIVCLFFGVVTYNAYAAFITSVLSVRVASLDNVAAVLHSPDFKIGYIKNGPDQMYLMSTKDAQLNAFYIRGYSNAENLVSSAEEGLARAARQDYAFFAGQRAARSTLRSLSQSRGRCAVRELPVYSTRAHLAFPLPHQSPYSRPTLVSLLQMRSGGALARLEAALVPDMPQCAPPLGFASARAADVRSALIILSIGLLSAIMLGIAEYSWRNRKELQRCFKGYWSRLLSKGQ